MKTKNALIIDNNLIDLFVSRKILESHGISKIHCARNCKDALAYLQKTNSKYHLILVEIYIPFMSGFDFIKTFRELDLDKKHGTLCLLSASINPLDKDNAIARDVRFIEKPLTLNDLDEVDLIKNK